MQKFLDLLAITIISIVMGLIVGVIVLLIFFLIKASPVFLALICGAPAVIWSMIRLGKK